MTQPEPLDELVLRYRQASAQDNRRPAERVRDAVRAHALAVVAAHQDESAAPVAPVARRDPAANQSRWKMSALASVALVGLTGLLLLQFDRGTPQEQELVRGSADVRTLPPPATPFPATADKSLGALPPGPAPGPESRPGTDAESRLGTDVPRAAVRRKSDLPGASGRPAARDELVQGAPSSPAADPPPAPTVANEARPAAPEAKLADRAAAPALPSVRVEADDAAVLAPATPARVMPGARGAMAQEQSGTIPGARGSMAQEQSGVVPGARGATAPKKSDAVPAARGATAQEQSGAVAQGAPRQREGARMARDPTVALRDIARAGDTSQLAPLLALGAALDGADEAGRTPLILAAINGQTEMVRRLLAAGANPALQDRDHLTALAHARRLGLEDMARMLEARR